MPSSKHAFRDLFNLIGDAVTAAEWNERQINSGGPKLDFVELPELFFNSFSVPYQGSLNGKGQRYEAFAGLVKTPCRSAAIGLHKDVFCAGFFDGLLYSIVEFCYVLANSEYFMPDIGDIRRLSSSLHFEAPGAIWESNIVSRKPLFSPDLFDINCEIRCELAKELVIETNRFLVLHEFTHAIAGHVGYLKTNFGSSYIDETGVYSVKRSSTEDVIQRVFEYDADLNAAAHMMGAADAPELDYSFGEFRAEKRVKAIAPFILLCLFIQDWRRRSPIAKPDTTHPEPYKRMFALLKQAQEHDAFKPARQNGVVCKLQNDLISLCKATKITDLMILFGSRFAEQIWEDEFTEEYNFANHAQVGAIPFAFASQMMAKDGIVIDLA